MLHLRNNACNVPESATSDAILVMLRTDCRPAHSSIMGTKITYHSQKHLVSKPSENFTPRDMKASRSQEYTKCSVRITLK